MYLTALERMWRYLHDDKSCVSEYLFVTDPYSYTSTFIDMVSCNPEVLPQLKSKMQMERMNSGVFGLFMREGHGMAEYRVVRMMRLESFREILENNFSELVNNTDGPRLKRGSR